MIEQLKQGQESFKEKRHLVEMLKSNMVYNVIKDMFNQAIRWGIMDKNLNMKASKPKREHKEKNFYNVSQVKKLLDVLENESIKYRLLIVLALDSGARRSEICAFRWSDINSDTRMMSITKSLKVVERVVDEKTTKTESSIRTIKLSESTINLIKEYKKWQEAYKLINKQNGKYTMTESLLRLMAHIFFQEFVTIY